MILRTDYSGTSTKWIRTKPRVVLIVPAVILVDKHSDCQKLPFINGPVGGMDIPTKRVGSTLLTPHVGAINGIDGRGGMLRHVKEHGKVTNRAALAKNKLNVFAISKKVGKPKKSH